MYAYSSIGVSRYKSLRYKPSNIAPSVLITLFHSIFAVVSSAVLVVSFHAYLLIFPPAVIITRFGSDFWGRKSTTTRKYVSFFPFVRICAILL